MNGKPMTSRPGYAHQRLEREVKRLLASDAARDRHLGACIQTLLDNRIYLLCRLNPQHAARLRGEETYSAGREPSQ